MSQVTAKKNESLSKKIVKEFESLGYTVDAKVLSANEYRFPQGSHRTIIQRWDKATITS